jgi:RNA polymerase sigma-70 factor (ECF subfamily)
MTAETFKQVYFSLHPKLYRVAFAILKNTEDAEDILQEMYCKLWNDRTKLASIQNPAAYCMTLVKNLCMDHLRSHLTLQNTESMDEYDYADETPDAETEMVYNETIEKVKSILNGLPAKQQRVFDLRVFGDCSSEEIERLTGESSENVRVLLSRARNTLRMKF